jgi:ABC-2 type transport system permease protein
MMVRRHRTDTTPRVNGDTRIVRFFIPFTSPVTMPMRMAATPVPALQIAVSLALLALGIAAVAWIAGKVYRVGILGTGKRPTLAELARWVRSA